MIARYVVVAAVLVLASFALWHPVKRPALESAAPSAAAPRAAEPAHPRPLTRPDELVVYVAGAVKRPGIYHLKPGDRNAEAVALAGGFTAVAQPGGGNLAARRCRRRDPRPGRGRRTRALRRSPPPPALGLAAARGQRRRQRLQSPRTRRGSRNRPRDRGAHRRAPPARRQLRFAGRAARRFRHDRDTPRAGSALPARTLARVRKGSLAAKAHWG